MIDWLKDKRPRQAKLERFLGLWRSGNPTTCLIGIVVKSGRVEEGDLHVEPVNRPIT